MIIKLNAQQIALKKEIKKEYVDFLTSSTAIDEVLLKRFISFCYNKLQKPLPRIFIADDPLTAILLGRKLGCKDLYYFHYFGVGYDSGWLSFYDYFNRLGVLKKAAAKFLEYINIIRCGAFGYIFLDTAVIAIRRPLYIKRDSNNRTHCENGPAIEFQGGKFKSYRWHGVRVNEQLILHPETLTKEDIDKETNSEVQRAIAEKLGWEKYITFRDVILIDKWFDETTSCHYELYDFKDRTGELQPRLLKMESPEILDGTRPCYIEPVPPESKTCKAARRWQCDPDRPDIKACNKSSDLSFEIEY